MGSTSWAQHKNLLVESFLVLTFSSLWKVEFKPSVLYEHVLCLVQIMKNDCYVFSSSNHQYEKYVLCHVDCTPISS